MIGIDNGLKVELLHADIVQQLYHGWQLVEIRNRPVEIFKHLAFFFGCETRQC